MRWACDVCLREMASSPSGIVDTSWFHAIRPATLRAEISNRWAYFPCGGTVESPIFVLKIGLARS